MQASDAITLVNTIGDRIKLARLAKRLTQAKLAELAGVSQSMIGNIEAGIRQKPRELLPIAMALGVRMDWLVNGKGQMNLALSADALENWPFSLFTPDDYELIDLEYRKRIENELAGEIQRVKRTGNGLVA